VAIRAYPEEYFETKDPEPFTVTSEEKPKIVYIYKYDDRIVLILIIGLILICLGLLYVLYKISTQK